MYESFVLPLLFIIALPWYPMRGKEPASTHSLISLLSCNWYWLQLFVGRNLSNNQLKELPEDIFRYNTELEDLWVDLLV